MAATELSVGEDRAVLGLPGGGHAVLERERGTATILSATRVDPGWVVHPALAYVAAVFSRWYGRYSFHGGAFVAGSGAFGVLGGHCGGKSTTLGWLARAGHAVLADDMLAVDGTTAFAGPRTVDLRAGSGGLGNGCEQVRGGSRNRLALDTVPPERPLRGWFVLRWGDHTGTRPLTAGERLATLLEHMHPGRTATGAGLLDLLRLPGYELTRPHSLESLPDAAAALVAAAERSGEGIEPSNRGAATACRF